METPASVIETLFEKAEAYSKTSFELGKLKSVETTSSVLTYLVSRLSVIIMVSLFTLMVNVGIALWLGELLGKPYYGFFIVAGFYCVAGIVFHLFLHRWIKEPFSDLIIAQAHLEKKINSAETLRLAIVQLEITHTEEGKMLKQQFNLTYESLKPINLIKNAFKEGIASPDLKDNVFSTSVGLAAGYLSKLLFVNVSHSPVRKFLGTALQFVITKVVAKNPEVIKSMGKEFMKIISPKSRADSLTEYPLFLQLECLKLG